MLKRGWLALSLGVLLIGAMPAAAMAAEALVNTGSPPSPFPQNKQNEPTVAIDPTNPSVSRPAQMMKSTRGPASARTAPSSRVSAIRASTSPSTAARAGSSRPTRAGGATVPGPPWRGPIGTLPNYFEAGLVSDGDPVTVFGPRPDSNGDFSWENGSRLYYSNLTSNFDTERKDQTFKGFEAIAVSHADNLEAAAAGDETAWSDPAIVTARQAKRDDVLRQGRMSADNAASSAHFGTSTSATRSSRASRNRSGEDRGEPLDRRR